MHIRFDGKPVTAGDPSSVAVVFNSLCGANFDDKARWDEYVAMLNVGFYAETPLTAGVRVDLVCHGLIYASFVFVGQDQIQISGIGQDDIARVYQEHQPYRVFTSEAARSIYEEACSFSEDGKPLKNPFCPQTQFQKFRAFAWGQFRVLTGADYLRVRKWHATARDEQERALYTSICEASPWYGDERIGARLKEDLFLEPSPF